VASAGAILSILDTIFGDFRFPSSAKEATSLADFNSSKKGFAVGGAGQFFSVSPIFQREPNFSA